jgi:hypothetical protein
MADTPAAHSQTPESRRSRSRPLSRSPPWWVECRGRSERRTSEIVVERVMERVASEQVVPAGNFPMLTKTNYYDWAALMHVMLQARGLWDAVIVSTMDYTEDRLALEVIAKAVPPKLMGSIASKPSANAAWESLVLRNVGVDRVCKAKASTLKREFDSLTFEAGESIDDFGTRLSWITNQLAVLGFEYKEDEIVRRFLAALPPKFEQIATSIKTLCDLDTITVHELIGRLKPSEERINRNNGKSIASLNLTEDELVARLSSHLKMSDNGDGDRQMESSSGDGKRGHGRGRGRGSSSGGRGGGRGGGNTGDRSGGSAGRGSGESSSDVAKDQCRYCGKKGHWARECKKKKHDKEIHAAQAKEEEESTLFMASAAVIEPVAAHDAHLLQVDLDPDQTRSATSTPQSNTIGNFNSPIKHDQRLQLPDQTRSATSTPRSNTIDDFNSPIKHDRQLQLIQPCIWTRENSSFSWERMVAVTAPAGSWIQGRPTT